MLLEEPDRDNVITYSLQLLRCMFGIIGSNRIVAGTDYDMVERRSRFGNHSLNDIPLRDID